MLRGHSAAGAGAKVRMAPKEPFLMRLQVVQACTEGLLSPRLLRAISRVGTHGAHG
jgi:hypothetical protein